LISAEKQRLLFKALFWNFDFLEAGVGPMPSQMICAAENGLFLLSPIKFGEMDGLQRGVCDTAMAFVGDCLLSQFLSFNGK
jgi:hypothetical protein